MRIRDRVDTLITIPNDRIFSLVDKNTSLVKAFEEIDEVLKNSVLGITELITTPGTINIDFADVKTIIQNGGSAMIGIGVASGADRSVVAANLALNSPLLEISVDGAKGVLFNISGQRDLKMNEVNEIAKLISENVDPTAKIIFGTHHDRKLKKGQIKVTLVATGFNGALNRNNLLFSGFFGSSPKPSSEFRGEGAEETRGGVPLAEKAVGGGAQKELEQKELKEISLFQDKLEVLSSDFKEKAEDAWEIPAFLRKRKRKVR